MKKIITLISTVSLLVVSCGPGKKELQLYNDQKNEVEAQIKKVQEIERALVLCIESSPDSCTAFEEKLILENSFLTTEIDVLKNYAADGGMTDKAEEISKFRKLNNGFEARLKR
jgi:hypothetical protein